MDQKPTITPTPNGPYAVNDLENFAIGVCT